MFFEAIAAATPPPGLKEELAPLRTLQEVVRWAFAYGEDVRAVIVQDEYSHDVVIRFRTSLFLVFDTT